MPRPINRRRVCSLPDSNRFGPLDPAAVRDSVVRMTVDEYETIRLIDQEGLKQQESADQMNVARTTVQVIYVVSRKKLADALVDGRTIVIEGGQYRLCDGLGEGCGRGCRRHRHGRQSGEE